jgi:hypothetical protein
MILAAGWMCQSADRFKAWEAEQEHGMRERCPCRSWSPWKTSPTLPTSPLLTMASPPVRSYLCRASSHAHICCSLNYMHGLLARTSLFTSVAWLQGGWWLCCPRASEFETSCEAFIRLLLLLAVQLRLGINLILRIMTKDNVTGRMEGTRLRRQHIAAQRLACLEVSRM